jgi:hypothetical protein
MLAKRGSAVKERVSNHCPYGSFNQSQASLVRTDQRAIFAFGLSSLGLFLVWACHSGLCEISPRTGQFFSISGIDKRSSNSISENTRPADYFFFLPGGLPGGQIYMVGSQNSKSATIEYEVCEVFQRAYII